MAFFLRLVTSNHLVTRSVVPTVVSASRVLSIHPSYTTSYTTMPKDDFFNQSWPRLILAPEISSMAFCMWMFAEETTLKLYIPAGDSLAYICPDITLYSPGLEKENMRACDDQHKTSSLIMKDGMLKENIRDKDDLMAYIVANIVASFHNIATKRSWLYYDMFSDRSIIGKGLCPVIGILPSVRSFSILKHETAKMLYMSIIIAGEVKMKLTTQGLCVSLEMRGRLPYQLQCYPGGHGLEREDVRTFFDYDTFFIEAKLKNEHYITGIRLPQGVRKKHNMIKREMKDGVLYAIIACCVKKEELREIKDRLKTSHTKKNG